MRRSAITRFARPASPLILPAELCVEDHNRDSLASEEAFDSIDVLDFLPQQVPRTGERRVDKTFKEIARLLQSKPGGRWRGAIPPEWTCAMHNPGGLLH